VFQHDYRLLQRHKHGAVYDFLHPHRKHEDQKPVEVWNMGVSADSALSVLDIRHEFDGPSESALESWDNFHNTPGNVGVLAGGKDWILLIPGNAIANAAAQTVQFGLRPCDRKTDQHYLASCSIFVITGRSAQILETVDTIGTLYVSRLQKN
jgi:hypothetical protein